MTRRQFTVALATAVAATVVGSSHVEAAKPKNVFAVNLNCYTWGKFNVAQCLDQIKHTSLRRLELPAEQTRPNSLIPELMVDVSLGGQWQYSLPDLQQRLAADGFQVESVVVSGYMGCPGSEQLIKRRVDFAEHLGARTVILACDPTFAAKHRTFVYPMLREAGEYAAQKGIRIAMETFGGITRNAEESLRTMREVGLSNVGINFDTGNVLLHNPDLDAAGVAGELRQLAPHVIYVHLKDVRRKPGVKPVTTVLGQGEVDFRKVFDILRDAGFQGPFGFDLETTRGVHSGEIRTCHEDLLASIEYLRSLGEYPGSD
jgi:sugar phosphate isomerase/epimerase